MKTVIRIVTCALVSTFVGSASMSHASASTAMSVAEMARDPYFKLRAPKIELVEQGKVSDEEMATLLPSEPTDSPFQLGGPGPLTEAEVTIDQIIRIGKKIYAVVEAGRPVVNIRFDKASALPKGATDWTQLERWSSPGYAYYKVTYTNGFGMDVVTFGYKVYYTPGGRVNGKGLYLANVTVVPVDTDVAWGFSLDASADMAQVVNVGTKASPIAGMQVNINWRVSTVIKESRNTNSYFVQGNGAIKTL